MKSYRYVTTYKPNQNMIRKMFAGASRAGYIQQLTNEILITQNDKNKENIRLAVKFYQCANIFNKKFKNTNDNFYKEEKEKCYNAYIYYRDKSLQLDSASQELIKKLYKKYKEEGINTEGEYHERDLPPCKEIKPLY